MLVEWVQNHLALSPQWLWSLLWCTFDPWPRNFHMPRMQPNTKTKNEIHAAEKITNKTGKTMDHSKQKDVDLTLQKLRGEMASLELGGYKGVPMVRCGCSEHRDGTASGEATRAGQDPKTRKPRWRHFPRQSGKSRTSLRGSRSKPFYQ